MAKASGGTRYSGPRTWREAISASPSERLAFVLSHISSRDNDLEADTEAVLAFDSLSNADRDEMLRRLNFTGMVDADSFYEGGDMISTVKKMEKDWMLGQMDQYTWDNEPDDDYSFTIGYSDGKVVNTSDWGERHKFKHGDVAWIIGNGLMGGYGWWSPRGKAAMQEYTGYQEWKNGKKL